MSKSGKPIEARLHITRALNPRQGENLKIYEKLVRKRFPNSRFLN